MSDSVILRSVKKFGEDNHGFESDSSCKWPFILLSLVQKTKQKWNKLVKIFKEQRKFSNNK